MSASPRTESELRPVKTSLPSKLLHDLRTPLNQIIGYSEMLAEDESREGTVTDLQRIRAAGRRMLALIDENFSADAEIAFIPSRSPLAERGIELIRPDRPPPTGMTGKISPGLLLVVDDDAANRDVLSRRLNHQGHTVVTATSGIEALQQMREKSFDLVLLDIMMPDMDGYEVLRRIKNDETLRHVPVIMISALSEVQSVVRCIEAGADDYLSKPFDPTLLKARIGASLERKRCVDRETVLFDQLQSNYKRLQEVEKLRDDMRGMIVHDLRTPLTSVIVGVEMLEKHGELNETQREMMSIAAGGGRTLLGMINDLLDVEKMEAGSAQLHCASLSATALVAAAIAQVSSLAEQGNITLRTEIPPDLPLFEGDESKLNRTLVNLIGNAIKFTREGTVTVSASSDRENIRFAIRDTGDGIPAESFERIFEKFGQLDSNKVGTGLGLAFCKLAVESHHGLISVESTVGAGSTFAFTIPLVHV